MLEEVLFNEDNLPCPITNQDCLRIIALIEHVHEVKFDLIEIVLVDEAGIVDINSAYLGKDYITDIITFDYSEDEFLSGTLYCCSPRIIEQSKEYNSTEKDEFVRVVAHGLLHLSGLKDKTEDDQVLMRAKEDEIIRAFYE